MIINFTVKFSFWVSNTICRLIVVCMQVNTYVRKCSHPCRYSEWFTVEVKHLNVLLCLWISEFSGPLQKVLPHRILLQDLSGYGSVWQPRDFTVENCVYCQHLSQRLHSVWAMFLGRRSEEEFVWWCHPDVWAAVLAELFAFYTIIFCDFFS